MVNNFEQDQGSQKAVVQVMMMMMMTMMTTTTTVMTMMHLALSFMITHSIS
jgi:hypothetical protein